MVKVQLQWCEVLIYAFTISDVLCRHHAEKHAACQVDASHLHHHHHQTALPLPPSYPFLQRRLLTQCIRGFWQIAQLIFTLVLIFTRQLFKMQKFVALMNAFVIAWTIVTSIAVLNQDMYQVSEPASRAKF